jgi:hypothetical protein
MGIVGNRSLRYPQSRVYGKRGWYDYERKPTIAQEKKEWNLYCLSQRSGAKDEYVALWF